MYNFCTIFDSGYLDKGLALYGSLKETGVSFTLYVFAFDDKAYSILEAMNLDHMVLVSLEEFETDEMRKVKAERSRAEYCWTCTPISINYVIKNYHVDLCTYIDSDIYFFDSPEAILSRMGRLHSLILTRHNFSSKNASLLEARYGKFCVQFNAFRSDDVGRAALDLWQRQCLDWCFYISENGNVGDQKYLDDWESKFGHVYIPAEIGVGVAPWNSARYTYEKITGKIWLTDRSSGQKTRLVFYHFQGIKYFPNLIANIRSGSHDRKFKRLVYGKYLFEIGRIRNMLNQKYGIRFDYKKSYTTSVFRKFLQEYLSIFKLKSLSDLRYIRPFSNWN